MIAEFLECLFRPNEKMTDAQMRKTGVITATVGLILLVVPYFVILVGHRKAEFAQFLPMALFVVGIFYGLGIHRVIWGNTTGNSLYLSWGKGLTSIVATVVSLLLSFFVAGFFVGYMNGMVK